jgi:hypothetical protein
VNEGCHGYGAEDIDVEGSFHVFDVEVLDSLYGVDDSGAVYERINFTVAGYRWVQSDFAIFWGCNISRKEGAAFRGDAFCFMQPQNKDLSLYRKM